jgi:hypothetical protein
MQATRYPAFPLTPTRSAGRRQNWPFGGSDTDAGPRGHIQHIGGWSIKNQGNCMASMEAHAIRSRRKIIANTGTPDT